MKKMGNQSFETYSRRQFLMNGTRIAGGVVMLGGVGSIASACSSGAKSSSNAISSGASKGIDSGVPKRGGKLVMGTSSEVDGFDPTQSLWDTTGYLYGETIFDPLAAFTPDGTPKPYLAQSIEPSSDFKQWTIVLRPNILFHDGTPLDSSALLMNLQLQTKSPLTGPALSNIAGIAG